MNCGTAGVALVGILACGVLMSVYVSKWKQEKQKTRPMDSKMFAIYNITLGLALAVMFYAVLYNALKTVMEVGRTPIKMILGICVCLLFVASARVINNWKGSDGDGIRDKEDFTGVWEMWVLLVAPYILFLAGASAIVFNPSFCFGA